MDSNRYFLISSFQPNDDRYLYVLNNNIYIHYIGIIWLSLLNISLKNKYPDILFNIIMSNGHVEISEEIMNYIFPINTIKEIIKNEENYNLSAQSIQIIDNYFYCNDIYLKSGEIIKVG